MTAAREMFGGRLSEDFIADKVGHSNFVDLRELDFPQSGIQSIILSDGQLFNNLQRFIKFSVRYTPVDKSALAKNHNLLPRNYKPV